MGDKNYVGLFLESTLEFLKPERHDSIHSLLSSKNRKASLFIFSQYEAEKF
jgi:hypothetical protein